MIKKFVDWVKQLWCKVTSPGGHCWHETKCCSCGKEKDATKK